MSPGGNMTSDRFPLPGLRGVCAALLPPEAGGPDPGVLAAQVEAYVARLGTPARHGARAGVMALNAVSVALTGRTLARVRPDARERVLRRWERRADTRHALEGVKALVLLVAGAHRYGDELLRRWQAVDPVRPDPDLAVIPSEEWPSACNVEAVVIGSGAGGAMAARTLARAGLSVAVLEEGRRWTVDEFRASHPMERFASLYREGGSTAAIGRPPVALPIGRGVGGTTLVNSGTCYRPPDGVMRSWRDEAGLDLADPDALRPFIDDVWETIHVAPVDLGVMGRNGRLMLDAGRRLGWACGPLQHNGSGCAGCCQSAIGCPVNAKFGVHLNALPQAVAAGARIVSHARVERVIHERGVATGVLARRPDGTRFAVSAPRVVVATGATETPALLRRSGLGTHHELGRNLAIHPAVGVAGRFDAPVRAWEGVLQSAAIEEFHASHSILVEATSTPPGMGSMIYPGVGRELTARLDDAEHFAQLGGMVGDLPVGRVLGSQRPIVRYDLAARDGARLLLAIEVMGEALFAAGASEVLPGLAAAPSVRTLDALRQATGRTDPRTLHLAAFHPTGTARAGGDPERSPVDERGRLRGVSGVWVADAAIVPSCPEVNPQVSIMALALAVAAGIADS